MFNGCKILSNFTCLNMKFHNCHHTIADLQKQGKPGQLTQNSDVTDFKNGSDHGRNDSKTTEIRASPASFFAPKDKMEPMEMYEELPSETEMGVSAYEIDR